VLGRADQGLGGRLGSLVGSVVKVTF